MMRFRNILKQEKYLKLHKGIYFVTGLAFLIGALYYKEKALVVLGVCMIIGGIAYNGGKSRTKTGPDMMQDMANIMAEEEAKFQASQNLPDDESTDEDIIDAYDNVDDAIEDAEIEDADNEDDDKN